MYKLTDDTFIKQWEALRLKAYMPTPNDVPTIGWGHTRHVKMGDVISLPMAQAFFDHDIQDAVDALNRHVKVPLNENQADSLISFIHNLGETNFRKSTLLRKLNAGDYNGAASELLRWNKQKGKVLKGLVRRREAEKALFLKNPSTWAPSPPPSAPVTPPWASWLYNLFRKGR